MRQRTVWLGAAAAVVLALASQQSAWSHGRDPAPTKPKYTPLPKAIANFKGYLIGTVVATDDKGCTFKVTKVVTGKGNKASAPALMTGKNVRVLYYAFGGKDGKYYPDKELVARLKKLSANGAVVTLKAFAERDEALIMNRVWPGADEDPERPDPPRDPKPAPDP